MLSQRRPRGKRIRAASARESLDTAVCPLVMSQMRSLRVLFTARFAYVLTLRSVNGGRMPTQLIGGAKRPIAAIAMRRLDGRMSTAQMGGQIAGGEKGLGTIGAVEWLDAGRGVREQVVFETA